MNPVWISRSNAYPGNYKGPFYVKWVAYIPDRNQAPTIMLQISNQYPLDIVEIIDARTGDMLAYAMGGYLVAGGV